MITLPSSIEDFKLELKPLQYKTNLVNSEQKDDTKSVKQFMLNETERAVLESIRMRLSTEQALTYLADFGFTISRAKYFRIKKKLDNCKLQRLYHMASIGFVDQHLERLDKFEMVEKKMWEEYQKEPSPYKRVEILVMICNIQPFISAYYDSTRYVVEKSKMWIKNQNTSTTL